MNQVDEPEPLLPKVRVTFHECTHLLWHKFTYKSTEAQQNNLSAKLSERDREIALIRAGMEEWIIRFDLPSFLMEI